jgi:hypothetical protein
MATPRQQAFPEQDLVIAALDTIGLNSVGEYDTHGEINNEH